MLTTLRTERKFLSLLLLFLPDSGGSLLDMASASSVQVVTVVEPLIQYAQSLFPEGMHYLWGICYVCSRLLEYVLKTASISIWPKFT